MTLPDLNRLLADSIARHGIPGASLALFVDGELHEAAAGVINLTTGVEATTDTVFPFGSVTKTVTASAALALVRDGRLALDDRVVDRVPDFQPADARLADIRIHHLLSHDSGLVGTIFTDTGRNDDALARQVALINPHPAAADPGTMLNYCNSGILLLGRLLEHACDTTWDAAIRQLVCAPLGMDGVVTRPEAALRLRTAVGHVIDRATGEWVVEPCPFVLPGHGPAGSTMAGRARDLIGLARAYLDGTEPIGPELAEAAWRVQVPSPGSAGNRGWGLGWTIFDWQGRRVVGHNGATPGCKAFLRVIPDRRIAIALLVNAPIGVLVYEDVVGPLARALAGGFETTIGDLPPATALPHACVGQFADPTARIEVAIEGDGESRHARLRVWLDRDNLLHASPAFDYPIVPATTDSFYLSGSAIPFYPPAGERECALLAPYRLVRIGGVDHLITGSTAHRRIEADKNGGADTP